MHTKKRNFACNFFGKWLFSSKIQFAFKKKLGKFRGYLEKVCVALKKWYSYNFHIWELYNKHFIFQKTKTSVFITRRFFYNQTAAETSLYLFSIIFRKFMKIIWQTFFLTLGIYNCMISILGIWRSTRPTSLAMVGTKSACVILLH